MNGLVYFASMATGPIKIGFTSDIDRRMKNLSYGVPGGVRLLATMAGSPVAEAWVHDQFRELKISGEWFSPDADLLDFIGRVEQVGDLVLPPSIREIKYQRPSSVQDDELRQKIEYWLHFIGSPDDTMHRSRKQRIEQAAERLHFSYTRTKDLWYGDARSITAAEYVMIKEAFEIRFVATSSDVTDGSKAERRVKHHQYRGV